MPETLRRRRQRLPMSLMAAVMIAVGCSSDERLVELSRESSNRQAEQNHAMVRQSEAVTQTTQELIKAESQVQDDATLLQQQLHTERSTLDQQRQSLDSERRELAGQRVREPIIAESIRGIAMIVVTALPLVICWYLARYLFHSASADSAAAEILIEELTAQNPLLTECLAPGPADGMAHGLMAFNPSIDRPRLCEVSQPSPQYASARLLAVVVLEGSHDVEFLKRISRIVSQSDASVPDLEQLESTGAITFVINNGASIRFLTGFSGERPFEIHIYDRESPPVTAQREAVVRAINARPNCRAFLTSKRAIENCLHVEAVRDASNLEIILGDFDDVAEAAARADVLRTDSRRWETLSRRARRRLRDKAKKWLNREAVDRMTPERLAERDPEGELVRWLRTISEAVSAGVTSPA